MKFLIKIFALIILGLGIMSAQNFGVPTKLINTPTAGTLGKAKLSTEMRFQPRGGVMSTIKVGIADRFDIGISYGGSRIIGNEKILWNELPGAHAKFRLLDEGFYYPGVALGFDSQGYGEYIDSLGLYEIRSLGIYSVASKNFNTILNSQVGLHFGINYSLEQPDSVRLPSIFIGMSLDFNNAFGMFVEYDSAIDYKKFSDIGDYKITSGSGFLNAGIKIGISDDFFVKINFSNLIFGDNVESFNREIELQYVTSF